MRFTTDLRPDDYRAFQRFLGRRVTFLPPTWPRWVSRSLLVLLWFLLGGVFLVLFRFRALHGPSFLIGFAVIGAIVVMTLYQVRRRLSPSENGAVLGGREYRLTEEGLHVTATDAESMRQWAGVRSLEETGEHFFLMVDRCAAYVIPKRSFGAPGDQDAFRRFVQERIATPNKGLAVDAQRDARG